MVEGSDYRESLGWDETWLPHRIKKKYKNTKKSYFAHSTMLYEQNKKNLYIRMSDTSSYYKPIYYTLYMCPIPTGEMYANLYISSIHVCKFQASLCIVQFLGENMFGIYKLQLGKEKSQKYNS